MIARALRCFVFLPLFIATSLSCGGGSSNAALPPADIGAPAALQGHWVSSDEFNGSIPLSGSHVEFDLRPNYRATVTSDLAEGSEEGEWIFENGEVIVITNEITCMNYVWSATLTTTTAEYSALQICFTPIGHSGTITKTS